MLAPRIAAQPPADVTKQHNYPPAPGTCTYTSVTFNSIPILTIIYLSVQLSLAMVAAVQDCQRAHAPRAAAGRGAAREGDLQGEAGDRGVHLQGGPGPARHHGGGVR